MRVLAKAKSENDPFTALALSGLITMFGLQAVINMGVNVALLPAIFLCVLSFSAFSFVLAGQKTPRSRSRR